MSWSRWYAVRSYAKASLWIVPFLAVVVEQILLHLSLAIDSTARWLPEWPFTAAATTAALQTIISLMLSFIVFTFGSLLVAIQVASGQLTPRIIATTLLRNNTIRCTVGLFVVTMLFALGAMNRVGEDVPRLTVWLAMLLGGISLAAFLYLIDYAARLLRPVSILRHVAEQGFRVIEDVYPAPAGAGEATSGMRAMEGPGRTVTKSGTSEIILALDRKALVALAKEHDGVVEVTARIGDFVAVGQALFRLHGGATRIPDSVLGRSIAFGSERTIEQDATFAFRVIVDIGIKALSKAINDPTTAVLAIDQLQRLLRTVGERNLHNDVILDGDGKARVILPTPNWEDFVQLTCREIRLYGAENFQIARRMRAMLDNLEQALPADRRPSLRRERELLDRMIEKVYLLPEDAELARVADTQGLGGTC